MNRREFVFATVTAAGTLACAVSAVEASAPVPAILMAAGKRRVFAVIFDERFEAAGFYAKAAAWRGHKVFGYGGDLTAVWLREIEPHWSRRVGALAGMTTAPALFCLEQLAAQHWLRVVTRIGQRAGGATGEPLISWVIA